MSKSARSTFFLSLLILCLVGFLVWPSPVHADGTPPLVETTLSGTEGINGWYTSTVTAVVTAVDEESGISSVTYQVDSDGPVTTEFEGAGGNAVLNPSFEEGWFWSIQKWKRRIESGWGWFWQSWITSLTGCCSASIFNFSGGTGYWHNRNPGITVTPGQSYSASVWARTFIFESGSYAQFEVWARGNGWQNDVLIAAGDPLSGVNDWTQLTVNFSPGANQDRVYLRLRLTAGSFLSLVYFDDASLQTAGVNEAEVEFNVAESGEHTISSWATNGAGSQSNPGQTVLKIDTAPPANWQNFVFESISLPATFRGLMSVQDNVSGIDVSTAEYAYYTDSGNEGWDHDTDGGIDWFLISSVQRISDGTTASDGETGLVQLTTPGVDFGDGSSLRRFLFRVSDMAGQTSQSEIQTIEGPWTQAGKSDVYAAAGIEMLLPPPIGNTNTEGLAVSGAAIVNFNSGGGFSLSNYRDAHTGQGLGGFLTDYALLKAGAQALPGNQTPDQDGIYLFDGDFTLDNETQTVGFANNTLVAMVIIEGSLRVKTDVVISPLSVVLWVVEGDLLIEGAALRVDGFFLVADECDTNIDRSGQNQLMVNGGLICLGKITLARDLGEVGVPNNGDEAAERIIFNPRAYLNERFASTLTQSEREYIFRQK